MRDQRAKHLAAARSSQDEHDLANRRPRPWRITLALNLAELYGPEVDAALGGREPMVDLWETGELVPTPEQVVKLAELTGQPIGFFYVDTPQPSGFGFLCRRGRGGGCEVVEFGPDADVVPISGQGSLW